MVTVAGGTASVVEDILDEIDSGFGSISLLLSSLLLVVVNLVVVVLLGVVVVGLACFLVVVVGNGLVNTTGGVFGCGVSVVVGARVVVGLVVANLVVVEGGRALLEVLTVLPSGFSRFSI